MPAIVGVLLSVLDVMPLVFSLVSSPTYALPSSAVLVIVESLFIVGGASSLTESSATLPTHALYRRLYRQRVQ